jgi:hypothetical protein
MNDNPLSFTATAQADVIDYTVRLTSVDRLFTETDEDGEDWEVIGAQVFETYGGATLSYDDPAVVSMRVNREGQCDVFGMPELDYDSDVLTVGDRQAITCLAFLHALDYLNYLESHPLA